MTSERGTCPYETASLWARLTYRWLNRLHLSALKEKLEERNLYEPPSWARAGHRASRFRRYWERFSSQKQRRKGNLLKCLAYCFWKPLAIAWTIALIADLLKVTQPVIVAVLVQYLSGSEDIADSTAYFLVAALGVVTILVSLSFEGAYFLLYVTGMNMRTTCAALIFQKVTTLSATSRQGIPAGHIVNLMATDIESFHLAIICSHVIVVSPVLLLTVGALAGADIGLASVAITATILIYATVRLVTGYVQGRIKLTESMWADRRAHLMGQLIAAMRVVKIYCWEKPFAARIKVLRRNETSAHMKSVLLLYTSLATCFLIGKVAAYVTLCFYVTLGHDLTPQVAVKLLGWMKAIEGTVFMTLTVGLASMSEMMTASRRIQDFLNAEDLDLHEERTDGTEEGTDGTEEGTDGTEEGTDGTADPRIVFTNFSAAWCGPGSLLNGAVGTERPTLNNVTFDVKPGQLVAIVGSIGAGKTSLLMAILKELYVMEGEVRVNGSVAYVPQESWILSDTVRANILMDKDMQPHLYDAVINACALDVDLRHLPSASLTVVGERGLSLSGGQKARINLARAVYRDADIYLLDDPLSAVDGDVGNVIFKKCICGMLSSKTRILVTHQLQYLKYADKVIVLQEGRVLSAEGSDTVATNVNLEAYIEKQDNRIAGTKTQKELRQSGQNGCLDHWSLGSDQHEWSTGDYLGQEECVQVVERGQGETEPIEEAGAVSRHVYLKYFKAGYGAILGPLIIILACVKMVLDVTSDWLLLTWNTNTSHPFANGTVLDNSLTFPEMLGALVGGLVAASYVQSVLIAVMLVTASRRLYGGMFDRVLRAPMVFFERHPVGQVLNRFSRDTGFMDNLIPYAFFFLVEFTGRELAHIVYACVVFPWVTIALIIVLALVGGVGYLSVKCQRNLKRIEAKLRSPTYSHLSAMLDGIKVIRAHRLQEYFLGQANDHMDRHTSAWFLYISSLRYLAFNVDIIVAVLCVVYIAIVVGIETDPTMAGTVGLSFVYSYYLADPLQYIISRVAELEMAMTSVERILQYQRLEQEAADRTDVTPPSGWPSRGEVTFRDVTLTYCDSREPALGPLSVDVRATEKVGIVGRTGAGKSSFFCSLLRMVEPTGSILIDGVDIRKLGLADLRSNISVVPQDPVLFSGLLRENLDPFNNYNDDQLWHVLEQVHLADKVRGLISGIHTEVGEAGSGFSAGQRQLLCLARALLNNKKVIVMDEATANVDYGTDYKIQETLSTQFSNCTVFTIAHRLSTVIKYDKVLVLSEGKLVQFGHPHTLLQDTDGPFYRMIHQLIPAQARHLAAAAEVSYIRQLDDTSTQMSGGEVGVVREFRPVIPRDIRGHSYRSCTHL